MPGPGGSRKGRPNKRKQTLLRLLREQYPDYHPVVSMAELAHKAEKEGDDVLAGQMHGQVAKYVEPQLKAVEHKNDGGALRIEIIKRVVTDSQD